MVTINYGGRLGISLDNIEISSNTIGFILNISYVTLIIGCTRYIKLLIPINLYYLYLTFSRGALLTFILILLSDKSSSLIYFGVFSSIIILY